MHQLTVNHFAKSKTILRRWSLLVSMEKRSTSNLMLMLFVYTKLCNYGLKCVCGEYEEV